MHSPALSTKFFVFCDWNRDRAFYSEYVDIAFHHLVRHQCSCESATVPIRRCKKKNTRARFAFRALRLPQGGGPFSMRILYVAVINQCVRPRPRREMARRWARWYLCNGSRFLPILSRALPGLMHCTSECIGIMVVAPCERRCIAKIRARCGLLDISVKRILAHAQTCNWKKWRLF